MMNLKSSFKVIGAIIIASVFIVSSCKKDPAGGGMQTLPADDAKVEIRGASQDVSTTVDGIMETQAVKSLDYFMYVGSYDEEWKTNFKNAVLSFEDLNLKSIKDLIREDFTIKSITEPDPAVGGIYQYNYTTAVFDLIDSSVSYLQMIYPADEDDFYNQGLNAILTISNFEYITMVDEYGYEENVPTSFDLDLEAYGTVVYEMDYEATYDSDGVPTSMAVSISMAPYSITMSQSISGNSYNTSLSFKFNEEVIISYNLTYSLSTNNEEVVSVSGHYQITPLRLEGSVSVQAMDLCVENDIDCMNSNMTLSLIHTEVNAVLGNIEARLYYDDYSQEEYPAPVIVYADGTWEWLEDIFDVPAKALKK